MKAWPDSLADLAQPQTVPALLERIRNMRFALDEYVRALSAAQLNVAPDGAWSVKHHLSHIAAWERMIVAHLTDGSDHAIVAMTADEYVRAPLDEVNDRLHALHANCSLDAVRSEYVSAHEAIVAHVRTITDDDLQRVYWDDDPSNRTVVQKIAGDTYLHYAEHLEWISEQVEGRRA